MQAFIFKLFRSTGYARFMVFLLHSLFILGLASCQKDKVAERDYPRVRTLDVTEITSTGAKFSAEIISGSTAEITEYGFVWSEVTQSPRLGINDDIDITGSPDGKVFSSDAANLESNKTYYLRSFVKTSSFLIYGRVVSFRSL